MHSLNIYAIASLAKKNCISYLSNTTKLVTLPTTAALFVALDCFIISTIQRSTKPTNWFNLNSLLYFNKLYVTTSGSGGCFRNWTRTSFGSCTLFVRAYARSKNQFLTYLTSFLCKCTYPAEICIEFGIFWCMFNVINRSLSYSMAKKRILHQLCTYFNIAKNTFMAIFMQFTLHICIQKQIPHRLVQCKLQNIAWKWFLVHTLRNWVVRFKDLACTV